MFRYIPIHLIVAELGEEKAAVLPLFHSFTGCDTVSSFNGKGKKTAWDIWMMMDEMTTCMQSLMISPENFMQHLALFERFVILMYDRTSNLEDVSNEFLAIIQI